MFIQQNVFENFVREMSIILFTPSCSYSAHCLSSNVCPTIATLYGHPLPIRLSAWAHIDSSLYCHWQLTATCPTAKPTRTSWHWNASTSLAFGYVFPPAISGFPSNGYFKITFIVISNKLKDGIYSWFLYLYSNKKEWVLLSMEFGRTAYIQKYFREKSYDRKIIDKAWAMYKEKNKS